MQEASRLVFVYVKDIKPKRKVAVPVPDGYTWAEFIAQVKTKLKIVGVKEVFLAAVRTSLHTCFPQRLACSKAPVVQCAPM